jgi:hypothetical protein
MKRSTFPAIPGNRWSAIRNLNIPVIFWSQGKHESTVRDALRRAYDSYERLDCGSLISGEEPASPASLATDLFG